ncbi:cytoplasmic protein [Serratia nevei]|uniref:cytoplasmic protein n=1 Tax=Serratia nevei TaxID=2703794 RepID=UPI003FA7EEC5
MQINEYVTPEEAIPELTDTIHQAVVMPVDALRSQPPARQLHVLREIPEAFPITAASHEEDTGAALDTLLARVGFTVIQAQELRAHRIRWPLMSEEAFALK